MSSCRIRRAGCGRSKVPVFGSTRRFEPYRLVCDRRPVRNRNARAAQARPHYRKRQKGQESGGAWGSVIRLPHRSLNFQLTTRHVHVPHFATVQVDRAGEVERITAHTPACASCADNRIPASRPVINVYGRQLDTFISFAAEPVSHRLPAILHSAAGSHAAVVIASPSLAISIQGLNVRRADISGIKVHGTREAIPFFAVKSPHVDSANHPVIAPWVVIESHIMKNDIVGSE